MTGRQGENQSNQFNLKWDIEEVGVVLGTGSERTGDKDQLKKFQGNLSIKLCKRIDNPQDVAHIPRYIKEQWNFMDGKNPKKLTDKGRDDPVESAF